MAFPIRGPIAPESNPPIVPEYFRPDVYFITGITQGLMTTITTNVANQYVIGQQVRFVIPNMYRMIQLDEQQAYVLTIVDPTSFKVGIDTRAYNTFDPSPPYGPTRPQVMAIGDVNTGVSNNPNGRVNQGTTIPGAFINTSPIEGTWLN